jgi:cell division protein FtsB
MMRNDQGGTSNKWLWRLILFLTLAFITIGGIAISKEIYRKRQVQREIDSLRAEAEKIKKGNLDLEQKLSYLGSQDYREKEAKDKLNLQSPGENVVVVKPGALKKEEDKSDDTPEQSLVEGPGVSNPKKWWNYFFEY